MGRWRVNPLSPHDAIKHHFTSLKTDLIFLQLRVLEYISHETVLPIHGNFRHFSPTSNHLHSLQVENCGSNSRLVVDEDDNSKFRIERVTIAGKTIVRFTLNSSTRIIEFR